METDTPREATAAVAAGATAWRPWRLEALEIFQATGISTPRSRHFSRGFFLLAAIGSGRSDNHYRGASASDTGTAAAFRVFEPEESWQCQPTDAGFLCLTVDPAWLQQAAAELLHREAPLPHFPPRCLFDPALTAALRALAAGSRAPAPRLQRDELLLGVFAPLLLRHAEAPGAARPLRVHPAVDRARDYLRAHYADEVPLTRLAAVARLSAFHLAREFRRTVGIPPHAYQVALRLTHARRLLAQGLEVGRVAHETGFFDQSHFARQFQRSFFVTPGHYRKTAGYSAPARSSPR